MPTILDDIVAAKLRSLAAAKATTPEAELHARIAAPTRRASFYDAITRAAGIGVIAEVKRASPSAGVFRADFDPAAIAREYELSGARAVSVLTEEDFFGGHLDHLGQVASAVALPLLRKEFILDEYQLLEARAAGASAVLLIAEILPGTRLAGLHAAALKLGLDVLVELHDAEQLSRVLDAGTRLLGINNRDLRTFQTRLGHTLDLLPRVPPGVAVVSESGVRTHADLTMLESAGVRAVLVGESLLRSERPGVALRRLLGDATAG